MKAIVHRKRGPAWEFEWDGGFLQHTTRRGTVYRISIVDQQYKPICIMRVQGKFGFTAEDLIRATHITFPNGGVYVFPGQEVARGE